MKGKQEVPTDITDFFQTVTVRGNQEYDFLQNSLSNFTTVYPVSYYQLTAEDIGRMDLISFKVYQTVDYWWLLAYVNDVENIFTDMTVGDLYQIPNLLDIYQFFKTYSVNTKNSGSSTGTGPYGPNSQK